MRRTGEEREKVKGEGRRGEEKENRMGREMVEGKRKKINWKGKRRREEEEERIGGENVEGK